MYKPPWKWGNVNKPIYPLSPSDKDFFCDFAGSGAAKLFPRKEEKWRLRLKKKLMLLEAEAEAGREERKRTRWRHGSDYSQPSKAISPKSD